MRWTLTDARRRAVSVSRLARSLVAVGVLTAMVQGAVARDNSGAAQFFSQGSDDAGGAAVAPAAQHEAVPRLRPARAFRPLTVRRHIRPTTMLAQAAQGPSKPEKVSIFEDPTLRRGDAVMTVTGIRIFIGSKSWPYRAEDFVALADAGRLDARVHKILASLSSAPQQ